MTDSITYLEPSLLAERQYGDATRALPTKQLRSEQTREKLLQTGKTLLGAGGFDDVSIAQIAAASGCSVGAFYMRFKNKKAYFEFLLDGVIDQVRLETQQSLALGSIKDLNLEQTIQLCVKHHIQVIRTHEGLIRAALAYSINGSNDWQPIGDVGVWLNAHYIDLIIRKSRKRDKETAKKQLLIGLNIIAGHLINVITHERGVMPLHHPDLAFWLSSIVLHCLKSKPADAA